MAAGGDADNMGRRLGVAFIVDGGVQRGTGRLRVTLRLVRTADAMAVWAGSFDSDEAVGISAAQMVAAAAAPSIRDRILKLALRLHR